MRIDITKIVPNRFRDFELDPIDPKQVERLAASIEDLGFFSGVTARKLDDGTYELAAGHHRYEAAKKAEATYIEAVVDNYTDNEMRRIMAIENLTQRGAHTGAMTDAVQAFAFQVTYETLTDRRGTSGFPEVQENQGDKAQLASLRGKVLKDGPGEFLIYRAINGFDRTEAVTRKEKDDRAEMISQWSVSHALKTLKESGRMGNIVARAYAIVEQERAEDAEKAAEVERKAEAKRQKEAEAEKKREADATAKAEAEAKRRQDELDKAEKDKANEAELKRKRAAKEKADADAKTKREAEAEAEKQRRKDEADRKAEADKKAKAKADKEAEEKAKIKAQQEQEKIYDVRCSTLFPDPDYAEAFRKSVTSKGARAVIPREDQYKVAKTIVQQAVEWKKFSNQKAGTEFIGQFINEMIKDAEEDRRQKERDREAAMRAAKARLRVLKLWDEVKRGAFIIQRAMQELVEENKKWDKAVDGDFPHNVDMVNTYGILGKLETMMKVMYGGRFGIPTIEPEDMVDPKQKRIGRS